MSRLARSRSSGFTLLELMIVVAILGIIAAMGVPQYASALRTARIGKARHELVTLSHAIDGFTANNGGQLPLTLHQVGFGGKRDPWGVPYCYLNYGAGTGDGLEWALEAGIVDPSAVKTSAAAVATAVGTASVATVVDADDDAAAVALRSLAADMVAQAPSVTSGGTFRVFAGVPTEQTRRRDRYMFPLNTDYDLFSLGPNGKTNVSLGQSVGLDDVIRANNGAFFGLASEY